jgi:hypothetical protein
MLARVEQAPHHPACKDGDSAHAKHGCQRHPGIEVIPRDALDRNQRKIESDDCAPTKRWATERLSGRDAVS